MCAIPLLRVSKQPKSWKGYVVNSGIASGGQGGQTREGSFTLPLLTDRAGYATGCEHLS